MTLTFEQALFFASILIFISLIAGKTSYKFGVPVLLFFLTIGMLAGSEGIGGIPFEDHRLAQAIGIIALNFILFSGGFETDWKSIKPAAAGTCCEHADQLEGMQSVGPAERILEPTRMQT